MPLARLRRRPLRRNEYGRGALPRRPSARGKHRHRRRASGRHCSSRHLASRVGRAASDTWQRCVNVSMLRAREIRNSVEVEPLTAFRAVNASRLSADAVSSRDAARGMPAAPRRRRRPLMLRPMAAMMATPAGRCSGKQLKRGLRTMLAPRRARKEAGDAFRRLVAASFLMLISCGRRDAGRILRSRPARAGVRGGGQPNRRRTPLHTRRRWAAASCHRDRRPSLSASAVIHAGARVTRACSGGRRAEAEAKRHGRFISPGRA